MAFDLAAAGLALVNSALGIRKQDMANSYASDEAQRNREFQSDMANTAYQRTMADMKAAGLNPMLAYSQGGSSVPTGSVASPINAGDAGFTQSYYAASSANAVSEDVESRRKQADAAVSTAKSVADRQIVDAELTKATVDKVRQEISNLHTDQDRMKAVIENLRIEYQILNKRDLNETEIGNQLRASIDKMRAEIPFLRSRQALVEAEKQLTDLDIAAAKDSNNLGRITREYGPLAQILLEALRSSRRR